MKVRSVASLVLAVLFLAIAIQFLHADNSAPGKEWKKFTGAWFEIQYPADFSADPSLKSKTNTTGCDSAFFVSPSKEVSFYVFSPQWNGKPTDILLKGDSEVQVSSDQTEKDKVITRTVSIAAKDGSYTRSYVDVENTSQNTRQVFGISYKDQKVYDQFKDQYRHFKKSLTQFGD